MTIRDLVHPGAQELLPHGQSHNLLLELLNLGLLVGNGGVQVGDLARGFLKWQYK